MTKIISGKKLLMIATITVLVTGLTLASTLDEAQAKTNNLKCNNMIGSFFDPTVTGLLISSSIGNCTSFGGVTLAGVYVFAGPGITPDCILLTSVVETYVLAKSGDHVTLNAPVLTQCFTDSFDDPVDAGPNFCGTPTEIASSTITGAIVVTGGLDNGLPITGGTGTFSSTVNHCANGAAPFGNSSVTDVTGTFTT